MTQAAGRVVVLGTGGTIAGASGDPGDAVGYRSAMLGVEALVARASSAASVESETVAQIDSKDMDAATWLALRARVARHLARADVHGVVVAHGTDTLEETAWWLARTVRAAKPVVLTGAMRPATARLADGPQNLADAIAVAATGAARGVVVAFAGAVHAARGVRKAHPYRLAAFAAGEGGPVAVVEEGRVRGLRPWPEPVEAVDIGEDAAARWPRVEVVSGGAAVSGRVVELLMADGVDGLVVQTPGNGSLHAELGRALAAARERGIAVLRATRCAEGAIVRGGAGDVFESADDLTPWQARVELIVRRLAGRGEGGGPAS